MESLSPPSERVQLPYCFLIGDLQIKVLFHSRALYERKILKKSSGWTLLPSAFPKFGSNFAQQFSKTSQQKSIPLFNIRCFCAMLISWNKFVLENQRLRLIKFCWVFQAKPYCNFNSTSAVLLTAWGWKVIVTLLQYSTNRGFVSHNMISLNSFFFSVSIDGE